MFTNNRASFLVCVTVAAIGLSGTAANARPCRTEDSTPRQERSCLVRSTIRAVMAEAAKQQAAAKQAAMQKQAAAKQAAMAKAAASDASTANSTAPADKPPSKMEEPAARPEATNPCLTKDHLDNGNVIFRDTCTGEWAERPTARRAQQ